jgi:hypothetical protein
MLANQVTRNAFRIALACEKHSIAFSVENPHSSLIWQTNAYVVLNLQVKMHEIVIDYCRWGEPWRKRTRFATWCPGRSAFLSDLGLLCEGGHSHTQLSGWKPLNKEDAIMRPTGGTAAYPEQLCEAWARLVALQCAK